MVELPKCPELVKELIEKENKKQKRIKVSICYTDKIERIITKE
jgi:hypothetical protein